MVVVQNPADSPIYLLLHQ